MITITGLTVRQQQLMDLLWTCQTVEQVNTLIAALPTYRDKWDARALVDIALQETLEAEDGLDAYKDAAEVAVFNARYS